jgi:hypothetical protein
LLVTAGQTKRGDYRVINNLEFPPEGHLLKPPGALFRSTRTAVENPVDKFDPNIGAQPNVHEEVFFTALLLRVDTSKNLLARSSGS